MSTKQPKLSHRLLGMRHSKNQFTQKNNIPKFYEILGHLCARHSSQTFSNHGWICMERYDGLHHDPMASQSNGQVQQKSKHGTTRWLWQENGFYDTSFNWISNTMQYLDSGNDLNILKTKPYVGCSSLSKAFLFISLRLKLLHHLHNDAAELLAFFEILVLRSRSTHYQRWCPRGMSHHSQRTQSKHSFALQNHSKFKTKRNNPPSTIYHHISFQ